MALGKLENEILELVNSEIIDISRVEELFKNGADPNALVDDAPDLDFDNNIHWSTFFTACFLSSQKEPDFYPLLEVFIKYGLDVNKYGSSLIDDFHFISDRCDIYEMTKLVLNNVTDKPKINPALLSIDTVESWLNCSFRDGECDAESNDFYGLYVLVESFLNNKPYNSFYRLPNQINEGFKNIYVNGNFAIIKKNKLSVKRNDFEKAMITKIVMENNTLIVQDNHSVYINNDDTHTYVCVSSLFIYTL